MKLAQRLDGQTGVVIRAVQAVVRAARDHARLVPCRQLSRGSNFRCRNSQRPAPAAGLRFGAPPGAHHCYGCDWNTAVPRR